MKTSPKIQSLKSKIKKYAIKHGIGFDRVMTLFFLERAACKLSQQKDIEKKLFLKEAL